MLKDYYSILNIPVTASVKEIKQAYRKLAMIHHPDKQGGNQYEAAKFSDIKEAYEILINPAKREDYLNSRWLYHAHNKKMETEAVTPVSILKQSIELHKITAAYDPFRMNHERLLQNILWLVSDEHIQMLSQFNEQEINETIISTLLDCTKKLQLPFTEKAAAQLQKLSQNPGTHKKINSYITARKKRESYQTIKPFAIIIIILLLCLLIYFSSQ
jgi:curved DNA-binding protein CbpA